MIQKTTAMGNWQLQHNNVPTHASRLLQRFLTKHQITQVTQPPLQLRFSTWGLLAFPKAKINFKRKDISSPRLDSIKYDGVADGDRENCVRSHGAYFEGD